MSDRVMLREYETWSGALAPEDAGFIARELKKQMSIARTLDGLGYIVTPSHYVGVISLPSGCRLEISSKVPVRNIFYMMAVALDLRDAFRPDLEEFERIDELLEFIAAYYADQLDQLLTRGLYRAYVDVEDNLSTVRGRVAFAEDLRSNYVLRHRTFCRFSDFTWDVPENQILRQVAHLLSGWGFRPALRMRLGHLDSALAEVTPTRLHASVIDTFHYHRFNDEYRRLHSLCRLFLEGASLSEQLGQFDFQTFLLDMNHLFELFVTQILRDHSPAAVDVLAQQRVYLGADKQLLMQPDILVRNQGELQLVADCKYKRLEPDEYRHHDWYQLLAYCVATNMKHGLLLYPGRDGENDRTVTVRNTDVTIRQVTLDLGLELPEFIGECRRFVSVALANF